MNVNKSFYYQITDLRRSVFRYYMIIVGIYAVIFLSGIVFRYNEVSGLNSRFNGMESVTMIFIFIVGLCSFKETFGMLIQNGISRKNMFLGSILTAVLVSGFMALADNVLAAIGRGIFSIPGTLEFHTVFEQLYPAVEAGTMIQFLNNFLLCFTLDLSFIALGYCITILYYRLDKAGKVAVSVGVPVFLFMVIPFIDAIFTNGHIFAVWEKVLVWAYRDSPFHAMISGVCLFIIFNVFSWLLMRKAIVKE